jgi:hypothetical protein
MTLPKNSKESASAPNLSEVLRMQRQRQLQFQEESGSAATGSTAAPNLNEVLRMQRQRQLQLQLQQESRSAAADINEESGYLLRSSTATAAPRGSHPTSRSMDTLRLILSQAIAIIEESNDEPEDSIIRRDDSNSQP